MKPSEIVRMAEDREVEFWTKRGAADVQESTLNRVRIEAIVRYLDGRHREDLGRGSMFLAGLIFGFISAAFLSALVFLS